MGIEQHRARKRFGQNFLVDHNIIDRIVRAIAPQPDDNLIEIGPGQGALTDPLLQACPKLKIVEIDRDLIPRLRTQFFNYPELVIHQADALTFDFAALASPEKPLRLVGNLPYNISTPLIFHLLASSDSVVDMHFMLQKEVVDRLAATPGGKEYGRLSVMVQYYCQVSGLLAVPPEAFQPKPKVDSAVVRLQPHKQKPFVANDESHLSKLVSAAFQQRRKTLRNNLKTLWDTDTLSQLDIDLGLRPEALSIADFVRISNQLLTLSN